MALFNYATKEITLKVVYYGPGLSGKTTNLQHLHSVLDPQKTGKLLSLATETDRTLFFDFLPIELGKVRDFSVRFQLYTVPGQVKYNATRKIVLKGADAVVFVADSQREMREANLESFSNMRDNLISNNINPDDIIIVIQYNKRDLPNILSLAELNEDLNSSDQVYIESVAVNGKGVQETFQTATKLLIKDIARKHKLDIQPAVQPERPEPPVEEVTAPQPFEEEKIPKEEPSVAAIPLEEEAIVISEEEMQETEEAGAQIISFEKETIVEERAPEVKPSEAPKESISEEDFFFTKEPAEPVPPPQPVQEQIIEEDKIEAEKPFTFPEEPKFEKEFSFAPEAARPSRTIEIPEVKKEVKEELKEPQIREVPVYPNEELEKLKSSIKEIQILPLEKINKMSDSIKENSQLLISLKAAIRELSDELKKSREEQKEMLTIVREIKINETMDKLKSRKKKGWFS